MAITVEVTLHNRDYIRVLVRSLQCLSRISPDLIIETSTDRLILRALSATQSAYAHFTFRKSFFHTFQIRQDNGVAANADGDNNEYDDGGRSKQPVRHYKVAVNSRFILLPFRQLNGIDAVTITLTSRLHDTFARIELPEEVDDDLRRHRAVDHCLLITCDSHISQLQRTYRLAYEEQSNILQAHFSRKHCATVIAAKAKSVASWIQHFDSKLDELTITLTPDSAKLKSFIDEQTNALAGTAASNINSRGTISASSDGSELRKGMQTEYTISAGEFLQYEVAEETFHQPLTFCLKEVKALLGLIEMVDAPVYIFAQRAGVPLMFTNTLQSITSNTNALTSLTALTTQSGLPEAPFDASESATDGRGAVMNQWSAELVVATLDDLSAPSLSQSQSSQPRTSARTTEVVPSTAISRAAEALLTLPTPRRSQQQPQQRRSTLIDDDQYDMQDDSGNLHGDKADGERGETDYQEEESEWHIGGL